MTNPSNEDQAQQKEYNCPQCGPDPRGANQHAWYAHTLDGLEGKPYPVSAHPNQPEGDELVIGIDQGAPDGDMTALTIRKGDTLFTYVGIEAELLLAYVDQQERAARLDELEQFKNSGKSYGWGETFAIGMKELDQRIQQLTPKKEQ